MLAKKGVKATQLVGGLEPADRDKIIDSFRKLEFTTLITTNVLARGIDVPEVDLVISYDVPLKVTYGFKEPDYANFMHRVGRTGRYGTDGLAVTLISDETEADLMDQIADHYKIEIPELKNFSQLYEQYEEMRGKVENN